MRAIILAAGYGTRLKPITNSLPKALIKIQNQTLLGLLLKRLEYFGFNEIAINAHYCANQIKEFVYNFPKKSTTNLYLSIEEYLLDTGGGIKKMLSFFDGNSSVLVHNVDVLSNIDLAALQKFHNLQESAATLAIKKVPNAKPLYFDENMILVGRSSQSKETNNVQNYCFCGIQVVQPELFLRYNKSTFYSIDLYIDAINRGQKIKGFQIQNNYWRDIGTLNDMFAAENDIKMDRFCL